jgi:hypothetical protein
MRHRTDRGAWARQIAQPGLGERSDPASGSQPGGLVAIAAGLHIEVPLACPRDWGCP